MLSTPQIADRLADGLAALHAREHEPKAAVESWLLTISARELLRVDRTARFWRHRDTLGPAASLEGQALLELGPVGAALASMHTDGRIREGAVRLLSQTDTALADRMLAVRLTDHVPQIREAATKSVLARASLRQADWIVPLLHSIEGRSRGSEVLPLYLRAVANSHGEAVLWSRLRASAS